MRGVAAVPDTARARRIRNASEASAHGGSERRELHASCKPACFVRFLCDQHVLLRHFAVAASTGPTDIYDGVLSILPVLIVFLFTF